MKLRSDGHAPPRLMPFAVSYSVIVLILVTLFYVGLMILTGVRGFVGGESSWSKAQKQSAMCLQRYAVGRSEADYGCYEDHTRVMQAARLAREELQKDRPDREAARRWLIAADAHPDDAPAMIAVFRGLGWHRLMRQATETWEHADALVAHMDSVAVAIRAQVALERTHDNPAIAALLRDIRATDARLTALEHEFSDALAEGARSVRWMLMGVIGITAALLLVLAIVFSYRLIDSWRKAQQLAGVRAARMRAVATAAAGVVAADSIEKLDEVLRAAIDDVVDNDMCTFGTYDPATHSFCFVAGHADGMYVPSQTVSAAGTPSERFLRDPTSILTHTSTDPTGRGAQPHGSDRRSESVIRCAMQSGTRLLGMIGVHSYTPNCYTRDDVEVIETLASMAASSIERIESQAQRAEAQEGLRRSEEHLAQSQKIEAVGLLAGGIAHDFNNLLTAVRGNADLLVEDAALPPAMRDHVGEIAAAADRAAGLTRQLLAFSRKQVLQPRVVDLNALVTDMGNLIRRLIGEDVELVAALGADLGRVRADPHQMEQVLLNLTLNARDAMPDGGTLVIETANVDISEPVPDMPSIAVGAYVRLSVRDFGTGISEEERARIFEPFYTTKAVGKGTGLGLSTVYGIVKQSGGHIYVQTELGAGTTMQIFLPRTYEALDPPLAEGARPPRPASAATVLVVEDEATVRKLLCRVLTRAGYTVIEADCGESAVVVLETDQPIDLVLTDTVMPGMNGVALAERAGVLRPGVAVLHMSGYTEDEVFRRGLSLRGEAFLQKPFSTSVLLDGVADALARARAGTTDSAR